MYFLQPADYNKQIRGDNLNLITDNDYTILPAGELVALQEMTSYLTQRYDTSSIFAYTNQYSNTVTYNAGDRVYSSTTASTLYFYSNLSGNTANDPSNTIYWTQGDNRNQQIVLYAVDITLYHIHSRISQRQVPDLRVTRYNQAIDWLKMVAKGDITANLPPIPNASGQTGWSIRYGTGYLSSNNYFA